MTLDTLKEKSIKIKADAPIAVHWPQYGETENLDVKKHIQEYQGKFNQNNSVISFVPRGEDVMYVTPYTSEALDALVKACYTSTADLYVPFSNWDFPVEEAERWTQLKDAATKSLFE